MEERPLSIPQWGDLQAAYPGLLSAEALRGWLKEDGGTELPICQDVPECHRQSTRPFLILFLSHTWEKRHHPDPTGRQRVAIERVLDMIVQASKLFYILYFEEGAFSIATIAEEYPKMLQEGVWQAYHIITAMYGSVLEALQTGGVPRHEQPEFLRAVLHPSCILSHMAVFYDYMCLPQNNKSLGLQRDQTEEIIFRSGLRHMQSLCRASLVCALRYQTDSFRNKAWCAMELQTAECYLSYHQDLSQDSDDFVSETPVEIFPDFFDETTPALQAMFKYSEEDAHDAPTNSNRTDFALVQQAVQRFRFATDTNEALESLKDFEQIMQRYGTADYTWNQRVAIRQSNIRDSGWLYASAEAFVSGIVEPDPAFDGRSPGLKVIRLFMDCVIFLLLRRLLQSPTPAVQVDLGLLLSNVMRLHGLSCTAKSDLTFVALTAAQDMPGLFQELYRDCLRQWHEQEGRPREDLVVVFGSLRAPTNDEDARIFNDVMGCGVGITNDLQDAMMNNNSNQKAQRFAYVFRQSLRYSFPRNLRPFPTSSPRPRMVFLETDLDSRQETGCSLM